MMPTTTEDTSRTARLLALMKKGLALPGLSFWAVCDRSDDRAAEPQT